MQKTWFITGASRGFGRIWAEAALQRGDQVTATARKLADVSRSQGTFRRRGAAPGPRRHRFRAGAASSSSGIRALRPAGRSCQQCRREPVRGYRGSERRADPRPLRCELLRHGPGAASGSAFVAETRERSHSRCLERAWDYGIAAHRLLLRHEMGRGSATRNPCAGGEGLRDEGDTC